MTRTLPMFPLGSVLVPTALLPLHVFEPRYQALVDDVLAADHEFGVVLIDRGHEVGGGEVRTAVGTVARIVEAREFDDGRWAILSAGTTRLRVVEWLADDPYPRAVVDELAETVPSPGARAARDEAVGVLRRVLALAAELGVPVPPATSTIDDDPVLASFNTLALAPIGALDQHRLLAIDDAEQRLRALAGLLREVDGDLQAQLRLDGAVDDRGSGGGDDGGWS